MINNDTLERLNRIMDRIIDINDATRTDPDDPALSDALHDINLDLNAMREEDRIALHPMVQRLILSAVDFDE